MDQKEAGQGTPFDSMTHETMLAWLDKADSGAIQGASDMLLSAATEIRKIAEELKVRPQTVEWKGEGATAFRTWSADLANATLRLGDYSEGASKWLAQASDAVASAKVAIPRTDPGAEANLDAARAAHNDPDASAVEKKALETLLAAKESNRQEAAAEMRRLAQSYQFSASQMDGLERPVFPPPPGDIVPPDSDRHIREGAVGRGTESGYGAGGGVASASHSAGERPQVATTGNSAIHSVSTGTPPTAHASVTAPVGMGLDAAAAPPNTPSLPSGAPTPHVPGPRGDQVTLPATVSGSPPLPGSSPHMTSGGRPGTIGRTSMPGTAGPIGSGSVGRPPANGGITGGRPVPPNSDRPAGGIPKGTVIGGEHSQGAGNVGRGATGHGPGVGGTAGGQSGVSGGRRLASEYGGVAGRAQQSGRAGGRPFTPGGSGLVKGSFQAEGRGATTRGGMLPRADSRSRETRRDAVGERPDYLVEDEETWQQGGRRVVPPVID